VGKIGGTKVTEVISTLLAIMYYIVPTEDQAADGFFMTIRGQRTKVVMPLEKNTLAILRPVAALLGCHDAGTKASVIQFINTHLTLVPISEARARWPLLDETLDWLTDITEPKDRTTIAVKSAALRNLVPLVRSETPQFLCHVFQVIGEVDAVLSSLERAEREAAAAAETEEARPPSWWNYTYEAQRIGPHIAVTIQEEEEGHDGYCSDNDGLYINETRTFDVYLSPGDWDFTEKTVWRWRLDSHCCCGAKGTRRVLEWRTIG
jgi:hypothetical protein